MRMREIEVGCYEGARSRERPAWVRLDGRRHEVVEIVDRWYEGPATAGGPSVSYFKVALDDGRVVLLRYVALFDRWALVEPREDQESGSESDPGGPGPGPGPGRSSARIIPFPKK